MRILTQFAAFMLSLLMTLGAWTPGSMKIDNIPEKQPEAVRIVSFNLRCADDVYGSVKGRSQLIISALEQYEPDSFGVQEAKQSWLDLLDEGLGDKYACVSQMRDGSKNSEASAVFYRKDKYDLTDSGTIWLSDTPEKFASKYALSFCPRIATWAVLENRQTGESYVHINTHLDHILESVRVKQVQVLTEKIKELTSGGLPLVCTGDFNTKQNADAYEKMCLTLSDSKFLAENSDDGATYLNYGRNPLETKPIDFVFVSSEIRVDTYKIIDEKIEGMYLSDHAGLCVDLHL